MRPTKLWKHWSGRIWGNAEDLVEDSFDQRVRWVFGLWKTPLPSHWQQLVRKPKSCFSCQSFMSKQFSNFTFSYFSIGQQLVNFHQLALFQLQLLVDQFGWAFPWTTKSSWRNEQKAQRVKVLKWREGPTLYIFPSYQITAFILTRSIMRTKAKLILSWALRKRILVVNENSQLPIPWLKFHLFAQMTLVSMPSICNPLATSGFSSTLALSPSHSAT